MERDSTRNLNKNSKGFTLLELLIVITILAVLSVAVVIVINPAETIKKARDTQRISDLSAVKTAISLYQSLVTTPYLGGDGADTICKTNATKATYDGGAKLSYSQHSTTTEGGEDITDITLDGGGDVNRQVSLANNGLVTSAGWIPIDLTDISTGSPISSFPVDPTNAIASVASSNGGAAAWATLNTKTNQASAVGTLTANALVYRYVCHVVSGVKLYEINAALESSAFTTIGGDDDKVGRDGGNSTLMYEVGTDLLLMGANSTQQDEAAAF